MCRAELRVRMMDNGYWIIGHRDVELDTTERTNIYRARNQDDLPIYTQTVLHICMSMNPMKQQHLDFAANRLPCLRFY